MTAKPQLSVLRIVETISDSQINLHPLRLPTLSSGQTIICVVRLEAAADKDVFRRFRRKVAWHIIGSALGRRIRQTDLHVTADGKPVFAKRQDAWFNISHCRNLLAVVVSRWGDVGIDIEVPRPVDIGALSRRVVHAEDPVRLRDADGFFECWTLKEAIVKAWGTGLTRAFDAIRLSEVEGSDWITAHYADDMSIALSLNELKLPDACKTAIAFSLEKDREWEAGDFPQINYI